MKFAGKVKNERYASSCRSTAKAVGTWQMLRNEKCQGGTFCGNEKKVLLCRGMSNITKTPQKMSKMQEKS